LNKKTIKNISFSSWYSLNKRKRSEYYALLSEEIIVYENIITLLKTICNPDLLININNPYSYPSTPKEIHNHINFLEEKSTLLVDSNQCVKYSLQLTTTNPKSIVVAGLSKAFTSIKTQTDISKWLSDPLFRSVDFKNGNP